MTTMMCLVPYPVSGLTLPSSRGGVSVSYLWHKADFCDSLSSQGLVEGLLCDFRAPVLKAAQLLPGSLTLVSVLQRPRGDKEVPVVPAALSVPSGVLQPGTSRMSESAFR